ncbi:MAG: hypothetical protein JXJ19_04155 [Elusimicrobia bacterium]|nr:hypothetical protein [Elusimicrobiota bacterium]
MKSAERVSEQGRLRSGREKKKSARRNPAPGTIVIWCGAMNKVPCGI